MIAPSDQPSCEGVPELETRPADYIALARYGRVPQVARFAGFGAVVDRGAQIVVSTDRGEELAVVLQTTENRKPDTPEGMTGELIRVASDADLATTAKNERTMEAAFPGWLERCAKWKLQLELIDLEMTLDSRLILYVLNDRGAETTRMALLAAAAGLGIVHVQPVSAEGIVQASGGGGCGSCSNHSH
jgi:hypothetical protein